MNETVRSMLMRVLEGLDETKKDEEFVRLAADYEKEAAMRKRGGRCLDPEGSAASYVAFKYRMAHEKPRA